VTAVLVSSVQALSYGFNYGVSNQLSYLISALRIVYPGTLDNDWYAVHTTHYHPAFTYLSAFLLWLDKDGWALAIADLVATLIGMLLTYWAVLIVSGRRLGLPVFLLLASFTYLTRTTGAGASYVFGGLFQPSSIGSLGLLGALPFFLRGRYLASGACLAVGGLFHANFLLLSFPMFGLAHLQLRSPELRRRLVRQFALPSVSLLLLSPVILAAVGAAEGAEARDIFLHVRSPHHYVPALFERAFTPFAGFQVLGVAVGLFLLTDGRARTARLNALLGSLLALLWVGTALTTATYSPAVAQLFVWRFAPFADLWCQLLICHAVVTALVDPAGMRRRFPDHVIVLGTVGLGLLFMFYGVHKNERMLALLWASSAAFTLAWLGYLLSRFEYRPSLRMLSAGVRRVGLALSLAFAGLLFVNFAKTVEQDARRGSSMLRKFPQVELDLYRWMREKTAKDAQFLIPPDMEVVRYHGRRAIVVDWKSSPIRPAEFMEWRRRIADVLGIAPNQLTGGRDLTRYQTMDQARLDALHRKYKLDYVLVRRGRERGLRGTVAYRNHSYVVLKL
jgi:hypothetical protein